MKPNTTQPSSNRTPTQPHPRIHPAETRIMRIITLLTNYFRSTPTNATLSLRALDALRDAYHPDATPRQIAAADRRYHRCVDELLDRNSLRDVAFLETTAAAFASSTDWCPSRQT